MNKFTTILSLSFALIATCSLHSSAKNQTKFFNISSDDRNIPSFNGIAATGPIKVIVTMGSKESCRLEGNAEALSTIVTEVKGNVLIIRPQVSIMSWSKKYEESDVIAYVTATSLSSVTMSGSGGMVVNGTITTGNLSTALSGSGSLKLVVDVDNLSCILSGSGTVNIGGNADRADILVSSSGSFQAKKLESDDVVSKISGSGIINIKANRSLSAVISGSGSVNYSGNASVDQKVFGSGRVRKI